MQKHTWVLPFSAKQSVSMTSWTRPSLLPSWWFTSTQTIRFIRGAGNKALACGKRISYVMLFSGKEQTNMAPSWGAQNQSQKRSFSCLTLTKSKAKRSLFCLTLTETRSEKVILLFNTDKNGCKKVINTGRNGSEKVMLLTLTEMEAKRSFFCLKLTEKQMKHTDENIYTCSTFSGQFVPSAQFPFKSCTDCTPAQPSLQQSCTDEWKNTH